MALAMVLCSLQLYILSGHYASSCRAQELNFCRPIVATFLVSNLSMSDCTAHASPRSRYSQTTKRKYDL